MDTDRLIEALSNELTPVRALRSPAQRAALWLGLVALISGVLIWRFAHLSVFLQRVAVARVAIDCAATALTGISAILAAFEMSVPGRSARWAYLPLPFFVLWLAASGAGCLSNGVSLHGADGFVGESSHCFVFILGVSVPLAAGLFWMLRRARPIAPAPVALLGTLGVAATAAFLLQFFHPFDVTVIDIALHLAAIGVVMLVGSALRRPLLAPG